MKTRSRRPFVVLVVVLAAILVVPILLVAVLLAAPLPQMPSTGASADLVIRNVAVVDVENGVLQHNQDVVVRDGIITSVGPAFVDPAQTASSLDPVLQVDGKGKYLIPGLWDMHSHSLKHSGQYHHPLFIANGVTHVREMGGCMSEPDSFFACRDDRERWNEALRDGSGLSPRYVRHGSYQVNGGSEVPSGYPEFFKARDAAEARQLVDFYAGAGFDFLKIYSELSPAAYRAMAAQARIRGIDLEGHRPFRVSLEEMLLAGQRSVEHARLFLFECHEGATDFRALSDPLAAYDVEMRKALVDEHDADRCNTLIQALAASETTWVPTLLTLRMSAMAGDDGFRNDSRLRYIPFIIKRFMWFPDANRAARQGSSTGRNIDAELYAMALDHVGQAHAAGASILTGTDSGDTYVFPGFSVHDELEQLVSAGLSPAAALKSATIDPAEFSRVGGESGSIAAGKAGDMILLDANPLVDVRNTRRINAVIFNGQFHDREALGRLLDFAERQAGSVQANLHLLMDAIRSPLMRVQLAD